MLLNGLECGIPQHPKAVSGPSLGPLERLDLLEMVEDRYGRKSIIIASKLPIGIWYEIIAEPTIADAILDRIVSNVHRIELTGESLRKRKYLHNRSLTLQSSSLFEIRGSVCQNRQ